MSGHQKSKSSAALIVNDKENSNTSGHSSETLMLPADLNGTGVECIVVDYRADTGNRACNWGIKSIRSDGISTSYEQHPNPSRDNNLRELVYGG